MENKLFSKLNNTLEINSIKSKPLTEEERCEVEHNLVFGDYTRTVNENLNKKGE